MLGRPGSSHETPECLEKVLREKGGVLGGGEKYLCWGNP